jgi:hypothetical protein
VALLVHFSQFTGSIAFSVLPPALLTRSRVE